jgi:hypothetical protein
MRRSYFYLSLLVLSAGIFASVGSPAVSGLFTVANEPFVLVAPRLLGDGRGLPFVEHIGANSDPFGTTLAMNTPYDPIVSLRQQVSDHLALPAPLKFFRGFAENGEAHITTITPVEYHYKLRGFVSPEKMTEIALKHDIQRSDIQVLGLGRGSALLAGIRQDTYFVIVQSENLLRIRRAVYQEYMENGGRAEDWDPEHFYPHITIGFTDRDLHESDGVIKDLEHSLDPRFLLRLD